MTERLQIKSNGWHDAELDGDLLTGDTYKCKQFIKNFLGGKWDADSRGWKVDLDLVEKYSQRHSDGRTLMAK